jgi:hypothetical protein
MLPRDLIARIRGEFREMPGLSLTAAQACRLWQLDAATCEALLNALLAEGFLGRTPNGMFVAVRTSDVVRMPMGQRTMNVDALRPLGR